jgi:hypothetical protein
LTIKKEKRLFFFVVVLAAYLELDAIELVEAGPGARLREALEELAHGLVVEAVRAVEDHALLGDGLGQVLGGLRLAGAGGALGRAAQVQLEGAHERAVAAVGERRDDEAARVAQVLVRVLQLRRDHAREAGGPRRIEVVAQLRQPLEVADGAHLAVVQVLDGVARCGARGRKESERGNETNVPENKQTRVCSFWGIWGLGSG